MDETFAEKFANVDEGFKADVAEQVKLNADVEDRFYATLSSEYSPRQTRPDYVMTVQLGSFDATVEKTKAAAEEGDTKAVEADKKDTDTKDIDTKDADKKEAAKEADKKEAGKQEAGKQEAGKQEAGKQEADKKDDHKANKPPTCWVGDLSCSATVTLHRRQENGPPLLVDRSQAAVRIVVARPDPDKGVRNAIAVNADGVGGGGVVQVPKQEVLKAVESAMRKSLRPMVPTIDRELMLQTKEGKQLTPPK